MESLSIQTVGKQNYKIFILAGLPLILFFVTNLKLWFAFLFFILLLLIPLNVYKNRKLYMGIQPGWDSWTITKIVNIGLFIICLIFIMGIGFHFLGFYDLGYFNK